MQLRLHGFFIYLFLLINYFFRKELKFQCKSFFYSETHPKLYVNFINMSYEKKLFIIPVHVPLTQ